MKGILFGFFLGVIASTVGFTGISLILDRGVDSIQNFAIQNAKD